MGVELLILALLVPTVLTKWVQDNRTDREYARQGMVSPRYQERLARLEKAGRPNKRKKAAGRGPLRSYLGELYADAMLDRVEMHRQKRAHRGPVVYNPGAPKLRQRLAGAADGFDAAVLGGIRRVQESQGWDRTKAAARTAGRRLVEPVGEKPPTVDDVPAAVPAGFTDLESAEVTGLPGETVSRRFDGQPETDADRRFFDLRESGYRGWIDQDGRPVDGPTFQQTEADGRVADVDLARTLAVYEDEGRNIAARESEDTSVTGGNPESSYTVAEEDRWVRRRAGLCAFLFPRAFVVGAPIERREFCDRQAEPGGDYCGLHADADDRVMCISEQFSSTHRYAPGTAADIDRAFDDCWELCGRKANNPIHEVDDEPSDAQPEQIASTEGPTMTSTIGEASTYETAVPALGDLQEAMNNLSDEVAGAEEAADDFVAHVEGIDEAKTQVAAAAAAVQEQMAAAGVSGGSMDQVTAAMEQVQQGDLAAAMDFILQAKQQLTDAKTASAEAAGAAGQAQQDLQDELGDAHERVASNLSGNGEFLNSGGGVPVGAGR